MSLSKADLWREFDLERPSKPRYEGLKGVYWFLLSRLVRQRDFERFDGECISCGRTVDSWRDFDPGHFVAASKCGFALLFDPLNVNGECKRCNGFDEMHLHGYAKGLNRRYGEGTAEQLLRRYEDHHYKGKIAKEWSQPEYRKRIMELRPQVEV